jgi:predicted DNA-binding protein
MGWKTGQSRYQLWLPDALRQRVEQAAKADKRKMSDYIRIAIEAACTKAEEQTNKPLEDRKNA